MKLNTYIAPVVLAVAAVGTTSPSSVGANQDNAREQVEYLCRNGDVVRGLKSNVDEFCEISQDGGKTWIFLSGMALLATAIAGGAMIRRRRYEGIVDGVMNRLESISHGAQSNMKMLLSKYKNAPSEYTLTPEDQTQVEKSQQFAENLLSGIDLSSLSKEGVTLGNMYTLSYSDRTDVGQYMLYDLNSGVLIDTIIYNKEGNLRDAEVRLIWVLRKLYISDQNDLNEVQKSAIHDAIVIETAKSMFQQLNNPKLKQSEDIQNQEEQIQPQEPHLIDYTIYQVDASKLRTYVDYKNYGISIMRRHASLYREEGVKGNVSIDIDILPGYTLGLDGDLIKICAPNGDEIRLQISEIGIQLMNLHQEYIARKDIVS